MKFNRKDTIIFNKKTFEKLLDEWLDKWTGIHNGNR